MKLQEYMFQSGPFHGLPVVIAPAKGRAERFAARRAKNKARMMRACVWHIHQCADKLLIYKENLATEGSKRLTQAIDL